MQGATYIDTVKTQKCIDIKSTKQNACISTLQRHVQQYHLRVVVRSTLVKTEYIRLKQAQRRHSELAKLDRSFPVFYTPSS
jgi:alkyl hydroperoxide reductase subunit AhpF